MSAAVFDAELFSDRYFGPENAMTPDDLAAGRWGRTTARCVQVWLEDLDAAGQRPLVLPRGIERRSGKTVEWYAMAFSEGQYEALREALTAVVGPTYSNFTGRRGRLDTHDLFEAYVHSITDGRVFRFSAADIEEQEEVAEALLLLHDAWRIRPPRAIAASRPTGRLLRDLELALHLEDFRTAYSLVRELRNSGGLSAENETYLEIRYREARGAWPEILALEELDVILAMRRPRRITEIIARAVYRTEISAFERDADAVGAQRHFNDSVLERYRVLFRSRAGSTDPDVVKLFMLFALSQDPPRAALRDELLSIEGLSAHDRTFLSQLVGELTEVVPAGGDPLVDASAALAIDDFELAFARAAGGAPGVERAQILIRAAYELDSPDSALAAIEATDGLMPEERSTLLATRAVREWLTTLERTVANEREAPATWLDWFARMNAGAWDGAIDYARQHSHEWPTASDSTSKEISDLAAAFAHRRDVEADEIVDEVIPEFLRVLDSASHGAAVRRLAENVLVFLLTRDRLGRLELEATTDVLWLLLEAGVSEDEYGRLIEDLIDAWRRVAAPAFAWWVADAADLLLSAPGTDARSNFFAVALGDLSAQSHRCDPATLQLLASLAREAGMADLEFGETIHAHEEEDPFARLNGKKVSLYSLIESACRRTRDFLEERTSARVTMHHDLVGGGEQLRSAVMESDVLVMAVRSAQHAATDFIKGNRPQGKPLLVARGKGSSSMIRAIAEWLDSPLPSN